MYQLTCGENKRAWCTPPPHQPSHLDVGLDASLVSTNLCCGLRGSCEWVMGFLFLYWDLSLVLDFVVSNYKWKMMGYWKIMHWHINRANAQLSEYSD